MRAIYLACVTALATSASHGQVTAPYSTDFPGDSGALALSTHNAALTDGAWSSPSGGGLDATFTPASDFGQVGTINAGTAVTNLGAATSANNWTESTHVALTTMSAAYGQFNISLAALGSGTTFSSYSNTTAYLASFGLSGKAAGTIGLTSLLFQSSVGLASSSTALPITVGDIYSLVLNGTYDASGNLTLTFTATDTNAPANTLTISSIISAGSVNTGNNFGLDALVTNEAAGVAHFSDFAIDPAVAVPEPSEYALMLLGGAALLGTVRRQKKVKVTA